MAGASMTARTAVAEWRGSGVAEWQSGRGGLASLVLQGQGDSRFSFSSAFLLIYWFLVSAPVPRLHSDHLFVFSHPPESLTHFAPGLCRIGRGSFWR